ncbi:MAG: hypothetical protein CR982_07170 [Candidatus Cloacimonadota bacterium]|nr:MAG: hypothetical protein CR982_07170 [Candidatus Cloacimonadota bacterium]PIE80621.1 MAG: hypothetical protein CSA15_01595 [Candidatus Delongbacteria bacterium]
MLKIFLLTASVFAFLFVGMGLKMLVSGRATKKACSCSFGGNDLKPSGSCCGGSNPNKRIEIKKIT